MGDGTRKGRERELSTLGKSLSGFPDRSEKGDSAADPRNRKNGGIPPNAKEVLGLVDVLDRDRSARALDSRHAGAEALQEAELSDEMKQNLLELLD